MNQGFQGFPELPGPAKVLPSEAVISFVEFGTGNTDYPIQLPLPPRGFTRYSLRSIFVSGADASLSPATCGVWTGPEMSGVLLVTSGTALTITTAADSTSGNMQVLSPVNVNTVCHLYAALVGGRIFFRVQTASAVPAKASLETGLVWLP